MASKESLIPWATHLAGMLFMIELVFAPCFVSVDGGEYTSEDDPGSDFIYFLHSFFCEDARKKPCFFSTKWPHIYPFLKIGMVLDGRMIFGILISRRLCAIDASILIKSRFSGRITLLENKPKKHSLSRCFSIESSTSGSFRSPDIVSTLSERVISISSRGTHAIGANIYTALIVSMISRAI